MIPSQRYGTIQDIGNAGVFLFSPAASYVNGAVLVVDGAQVSSGLGLRVAAHAWREAGL
jgi:2,4-dienoyl-CoA reductase [(3E)-enoyl-CoA-producing], peroxisomal